MVEMETDNILSALLAFGYALRMEDKGASKGSMSIKMVSRSKYEDGEFVNSNVLPVCSNSTNWLD